MPRYARKPRTLSPQYERSADYVNTTMLSWRQQDPRNRATTTFSEIARGIGQFYREGPRKVATSTLTAWMAGDNIPNPESSYAFACFFGVPLHEAFAAFGHDVPTNFDAFYQRVEQEGAAWPDRSPLLARLQRTRHWGELSRESPWWQQLAHVVLVANTDLHTKAQQIAYLADAEGMFGMAEAQVKHGT